MAVDKDIIEKMRAFINNPSDETLKQMIPHGFYYCCLSYLVEDFTYNTPYCPKECPGGDTTYDGYYRLCLFGQLKRLWEVDQAKVILYVIRLLAYAESHAGINSQSRG